MISEFGDLLLVRWVFSDGSGSKPRPGIVVSRPELNAIRKDLLLIAVSGVFLERPKVGEIVIEEWEAAGLERPSVIKPVIATLNKSRVLRPLGALQLRDRERLARLLSQIFGLVPELPGDSL